MAKKNLFLCVAGETVPTVTEGIFGLCVERKIPLHNIRILTTSRGRDKLDSEFPEVFKKMKKDYPNEIGPLHIDLKEDIGVCKDKKGNELEDIRNEEENNLVADWMLGEVAKCCSDPDTIIHASVAGGRKTMSVYLDRTLQILGRIDDHLYHVLVDPKYEIKGFYYPTPYDLIIETREGSINAKDAKVYMAEIPFVRMGALFDKELLGKLIAKNSFNTLIQRADNMMRGPSLDVHVFWKEGRIEYRSGQNLIAKNEYQNNENFEFIMYSFLLWKRCQDLYKKESVHPMPFPLYDIKYMERTFAELEEWTKRLSPLGHWGEELEETLDNWSDANHKDKQEIRKKWRNRFNQNIGHLQNHVREAFDPNPQFEPSFYLIGGIGHHLPQKERGYCYINIPVSLIHFEPEL